MAALAALGLVRISSHPPTLEELFLRHYSAVRGRVSALSGTWALVRLNLRRDRVRLAIWTLSLAGITTWAAAAVIDLYPNREALAVYARTISGNTAVIALSAPPARLDTYGGRVAFEIWQYGIAVALMAVFAVSRSARAEEELGRAELVRATAVGRHAHSTAALIANALSMLLLAVLLALGLAIAGLDAGGRRPRPRVSCWSGSRSGRSRCSPASSRRMRAPRPHSPGW